MAYENQEKCPRCGISIPKMPEDAAYEERLCNGCHDEVVMKRLTTVPPEDNGIVAVINIGHEGLLNCEAYLDTPYGNEQAEKFFRTCAGELGAGSEDIEIAVEDGYYSGQDGTVYITHMIIRR